MTLQDRLLRNVGLSATLLLIWGVPASLTAPINQTSQGAATQNQKHGEPAKATSQPVSDAAAPAGNAEKARAMLEQALARYRGLESYEDRVETRYDIQMRPGAETPGDYGFPEASSVSLAFARPKRIAIATDTSKLVCDGQRLWRVSDELEEYSEESADELTDFVGTMAMFSPMAHPLSAVFLDRDKSIDELLELIFSGASAEIRGVEPLVRDGHSGQSVVITVQVPVPRLKDGLPVRMWFDDETGQLREIRCDMRKVMEISRRAFDGTDDDEDADDEEDSKPETQPQKSGGKKSTDEPLFIKAEVSMVFTDIRFNPSLPAERFEYKPNRAFRKVESLNWVRLAQAPRLRQLRLIGKPAPEFAATDLDGQPFKRADAAGHVVVLLFWHSLDTGAADVLRDMQRVANKYTEKDVLLVGVIQDKPASAERVRTFTARHKINFRQLMDADGQMAKDFSIMQLPCVVLIDRQGQIQEISGDTATLADDLPEQLDRILAGKSLYTAAELAERIREARGDDDETDEAATDSRKSAQDSPTSQATTRAAIARKPKAEESDDEDEDVEEDEEQPKPQSSALAEVTPERLVTGRKASVLVSGYQTRELDVDGDGKPDLIMPSWQGEITVVSADGSHVRKLRLRGLGMGMNIMGVRPVRLDGALHWLVSYSKFGGSGQQSSASVSLFDDKGARLWQYRLPGGKQIQVNASVAAGDLTGDGVPEFVVGVSVSKMRKMSGNSWTSENPRGYLVVLDAKGVPLVCKRIGQSAEYVAVAEPDAAGKRAILLFEGGSMHRLYYDPAVTTRPAKEQNEDEDVDADEDEE